MFHFPSLVGISWGSEDNVLLSQFGRNLLGGSKRAGLHKM